MIWIRGVAHADVAIAIEDAFGSEDVIGGDEVVDEGDDSRVARLRRRNGQRQQGCERHQGREFHGWDSIIWWLVVAAGRESFCDGWRKWDSFAPASDAFSRIWRNEAKMRGRRGHALQCNGGCQENRGEAKGKWMIRLGWDVCDWGRASRAL